jgi:hypothetical protein
MLLFDSCRGNSLSPRPQMLHSSQRPQDHRYNMVIARCPVTKSIFSFDDLVAVGLTKYHLSS